MEHAEETVEMEMDSTSSDSPDDDDCSPRIGDEYQVDIPQLATRDFLGLGLMDEDEAIFATGVPVRITTIHMLNDRKQEGWLASSQEQQADGEADDDADYPRGGKLRKGKRKKRGGWSNMRRLRAKNSCEEVVIPGDSFEEWEESEVSAFLLGLYLLGKDFTELKRFVETRTMTDLQHYYYSRFYGSVAYKRWFAARNSTSRRIVNGHHILVGWRQEEFLRRLLAETEESKRPILFEAIADFNRGAISFSAFVYRVKDAVGLELFVDAVALGYGKRDLTVGTAEPAAQSNKKLELPAGKDFSEFTALEMSRALSGVYRLSKTRSQDLFWEAIWPRLLAKGWSSEESASKGPLVYMVPGIKRYSKRHLVKGKDYFDSITEVLNHLSTNPDLLELPELDNELLSKSRMPHEKEHLDKNERKQIWLSKGTSHSKAAADQRPDSSKAPAKLEDGGGPSSSPKRVTRSRSVSPDGGRQQPPSASRFEQVMARGFEAEAEGHELVTRKRNFYNAFPGTGVQAGLAAVGLPAGRKVWLDTMIKQYLGNGKSVRLYGPVTSSRLLQAAPWKEQAYGMCRVLMKQEVAKEQVADMLVRLGSGIRLAVSWKLEQKQPAVTMTATIVESRKQLESHARLEEICCSTEDVVELGQAPSACKQQDSGGVEEQEEGQLLAGGNEDDAERKSKVIRTTSSVVAARTDDR